MSPQDVEPANAASPELTEAAITLVEQWLKTAKTLETKKDRAQLKQLEGVVSDPAGVKFAMRFVDQVIRPEDNAVAAGQLAALVNDRPADEPLPKFLSVIDKNLLRAGAKLAPTLPNVVMPLAVRRMRQIVGHLVVDSEPTAMAAHLARRKAEGFDLNVNQLGEAVLGDAEADRRLEAATALLDDPNVDYVSVKLSSIVSQLNYWAWDESIERVLARLRPLLLKAQEKGTFINLDMEEYHDLELTMLVFKTLLDEPELHGSNAGIVLQTYLPDSFPALQELVEWANERRNRLVDGLPGGQIKIRLVKGANLAMERVEAAIHDWPQAPYLTKAEVDANYKRCLNWVLTPERTAAVRIGLASHNLFDVAWGHLLSESRSVSNRLELEMLQGMAPPHAKAAQGTAGDLLLYTPVVSAEEFDVAISYLFRRLEENSSDANFIRHLFSLEPGSKAFESEANKFRAAVATQTQVATGPARTQDRYAEAATEVTPTVVSTVEVPAIPEFENEPDTDPALAHNRAWAAEVVAQSFEPVRTPLTVDTDEVDRVVAKVAQGQTKWAGRPATERQAILMAVAEEFTRRRGDFINAMIYEGSKTFEQADPEMSEAIDFARWYARQITSLHQFEWEQSGVGRYELVNFTPFGVIVVTPPWNFPVAIPAGGVLAALAAGNSVILKPAPDTARCAEIVAECCWAAGVPDDALQFIRTPDNEVGQHLVTHEDVSAVILTGAYETADMFRSWKPELPIFAETSGKNALVVTANADLDLAVADLAYSAFGHSGQKCSAASLGILVGDVYHSERFRRQLIDAVTSLTVGPSWELGTNMTPLVTEPEGKLLQALTKLEPGEEWLIKPERLESGAWTPGVRIGVKRDSWFHQTECFGPVLGLMEASSLDEAIEMQNSTGYGLTGGLHSLDQNEIDLWTDRVEIGNAYINRTTTGAIVQRQPFGGWKRSAIGPGAKAGGPNYVAQLGDWQPTAIYDLDEDWLAAAKASDARWWDTEFGVEHDPTGLFCEANVFRYRPLETIAVRVERTESDDSEAAKADDYRLDMELKRVMAAAEQCGVNVEVSDRNESPEQFARRMATGLGTDRVRVLGKIDPAVRLAAHAAGVHLADDAVTANGRIELLHYLREQAVSRTTHRYGNLL